MLKLLSKDTVPYLLTVLFATLGWTLTTFVSQIGSSPIIEYTKTRSNNLTEVTFEVQNISKNIKFTNLIFYILLNDNEPGRCVGKPVIVPIAPLHFGKDREEPICREGVESVFLIDEFHPYSKVSMSVIANGKTDAEIRLTSSNAVLLKEENYQTRLIKYELEILIFMIAFWTVCIIMFYL